MTSINIDSVFDKVHDWEKSNKGQKKIQSKVSSYVSKNTDKTQAGSTVVTVNKMSEMSRKLVSIIKEHASSCGLPQSVMKHFDSLYAGTPTKQSDGSYVIEISFRDDLSRPSLRPEDYDGVRNIVAIFNNGYPGDRRRSEAISHISGWWHGKETTALEYRPGLYFLQDAVNDFNTRYGMKLGMYAEVGVEYESG